MRRREPGAWVPTGRVALATLVMHYQLSSSPSSMPKAPSLAGRAVAAVLLLVGFYLLAIGLVIALVAIPWAEWHYAGRIDLRILIGCLVSAFLIAASILPRPDKFNPPGPLLEEKDQPQLFETIRELSSKTGQAMPVEVYLDADLNAYVSQRGGVMGFGSRRIMGLGLPLLQLLSVSQMKAVLAHEFGHFYGGDTALGPWIYKTRAALGRTIMTLAASRSILTKIFDWYAGAFIRITHAISRRQEFAADALAATTVGATPLIDGLRMIHGGSTAFYSYWNNEVAPVLERGYALPYASGFQHLLKQPHVQQDVESAIEEEMRSGKVNPADTHPPLNERVRALADFPSSPAPPGEARAISLINDPENLESRLLQMMAERAGKQLTPITWAESAEKVWVENWKSLMKEHGKRLEGITPDQLPLLLKDQTDLALALRFAPTKDHVMQEHRAAAINITGAALGLALRAQGWAASANPGEPILMKRDGVVVAPFAALGALNSGALAPEQWEQICREAGIWEVDLAKVG
jgi:heat shock protein HtpX